MTKSKQARDRWGRKGFTLVEVGVSLIIMAAAMVLVVQLAYWSLAHRTRSSARFVAIESAANIIESAYAAPWDKLDQLWADSIRLPDAVAAVLHHPSLSVAVTEPEGMPFTKRVAVELKWSVLGGESHTCQMVGVVAERSAPANNELD